MTAGKEERTQVTLVYKYLNSDRRRGFEVSIYPSLTTAALFWVFVFSHTASVPIRGQIQVHGQKHGILTTGSPGKSSTVSLFIKHLLFVRHHINQYINRLAVTM